MCEDRGGGGRVCDEVFDPTVGTHRDPVGRDRGAQQVTRESLERGAIGGVDESAGAAATAAAYAASMRAWLADRPGRALWVDLELAPDNSDRAHLAAITVHAADRAGSVHDLVLGRTSYHPTDVVVDDAAVTQLTGLLAP
jgi:hypothetical protein